MITSCLHAVRQSVISFLSCLMQRSPVLSLTRNSMNEWMNEWENMSECMTKWMKERIRKNIQLPRISDWKNRKRKSKYYKVINQSWLFNALKIWSSQNVVMLNRYVHFEMWNFILVCFVLEELKSWRVEESESLRIDSQRIAR